MTTKNTNQTQPKSRRPNEGEIREIRRRLTEMQLRNELLQKRILRIESKLPLTFPRLKS